MEKQIEILDKETEKELSDRIKFTWEQFNKQANLLISLSTGTIVLFGNFSLKDDSAINVGELSLLHKWMAVIPIILLIIGLISALVWRFYSQIGMEKEVLGDRNKLKLYFESTGMKETFTKFFDDVDEKKVIWKWKLAHTLTIVFLFSGWISLAIFFIVQILIR